MIKFENLTEILRQRLRNGFYPAGSRFPSIYELANEYEINKNTANKALLALLKEGFLRRGRSSREGMIVKTNSPFPAGRIAYLGIHGHSFFSKIAKGAYRAASQKNYLIMPFCPLEMELSSTLEMLSEAGFEGIISNGYGTLATQLPVIYTNECLHDSANYHVWSDDFAGGSAIAELLLENIDGQIVFLATAPDSIRLNGFRSAMRKAGVKDFESHVFYLGNIALSSTIHELKKILNSVNNVRAIAMDSDDRVVTLIHASRILGVRIPEDIVVTGYGNLKEVQAVFPFPTVEQTPEAIGSLAAQKLIELLANGPENVSRQELLHVSLVNAEYVALKK